MTGLTISRGFGLVAALAVSGTALFLAYGYKKRTLHIRRGKGCLKYEHHRGEPPKKEGVITVELPSKGKDNGKGGVHLPPQISRRPQKSSRSSVCTHEPTREEEMIKEKLVKCPDAELISILHKDARSSFRDADQLVEQLENMGSDTASLKSSDLSGRLDNLNKGVENPLGNGANGKVAGKPKKQVRFCPSVAEPSSNNYDYKRRGRQQRGGAHTVAQEQPSEAIRTAAHARPRLYSQAAKQTITYNIGRFDYRYSSMAYPPGHL
ncbi:hypothetical protein Mapa_003513 [Marchantia paleacea]|nr:hypothetical protein Mapa_003513 [Marchantia paleacea]